MLMQPHAEKEKFLRATAVPTGTPVAGIGIMYVCLSVCPSRPGTDSMPREIETPVFTI